MPLRTAVILALAAAAGIVVGCLTYAVHPNWPAALLAGILAGGPAVPYLHQLVE